MANSTDFDESVTNDNRITISNLQQLHSCLIDATMHFNSYYGPQLLCWIPFILFDMITYIFNTIYIFVEAPLICLGCVAVLYYFIQFIFICRICHLTCYEVRICYVFSGEREEFFLI